MLSSYNLFLRPITEADQSAVFAYRSNAESNRFQGFVPKDLQEVKAFIARNPAEFNKPNTWFQLVIIETASGQLIGDIGVHFVGDDDQQCELGCTLSKDFQGKGYAAEAMRLVIDHLFRNLHKHKIYCSVDPRNTSAIQLMERLHFRKEAHHRKSLLWKGVWVDDVIYAVLKEEWKA